MSEQFTAHGKQVLRAAAHYADAVDDEAALTIARALNVDAQLARMQSTREDLAPAPRIRAPQDRARWPAEMSQDEIETAIDELCGCAGLHACDCISVFNLACSRTWEKRNLARAESATITVRLSDRPPLDFPA